ncbi:MAG: nucleotidyl transferase AbiEii/AbiGii toxin family protein [Tannerella sp.]|jgi:predicted nucleotidyltransferase component of viral defense system|nr:nucleotidyl transferase AbiEii/AbiGii toxin family protein [Tannerella sp.]
MISKNEINRLATEQNVQTSTIDKDWVLGHFIDAIYSIPECRENLIFKGGTCLKKSRLYDFRFSEDLDFTSLTNSFIFDLLLLENIVSLVEIRTGMPLSIQSLEELHFNNQLTGYSARVKYWGADHRKDQQPPDPSRWLTSIKIEIILYEIMVFEADMKNIYHPYSDKLTEHALNVPVYCIHEVLAEKIRALIQRSYTAPRDYYDIWFLNKHVENIDWKAVTDAFRVKAIFKGITFSGIEQLLNDENDRTLRASWKNSLEHQISVVNLPEYEIVRGNLFTLFEQIFSNAK